MVGCVGWMGSIKILVEAVCSQIGEHVSTEANGRPSCGVCERCTAAVFKMLPVMFL